MKFRQTCTVTKVMSKHICYRFGPFEGLALSYSRSLEAAFTRIVSRLRRSIESHDSCCPPPVSVDTGRIARSIAFTVPTLRKRTPTLPPCVMALPIARPCSVDALAAADAEPSSPPERARRTLLRSRMTRIVFVLRSGPGMRSLWAYALCTAEETSSSTGMEGERRQMGGPTLGERCRPRSEGARDRERGRPARRAKLLARARLAIVSVRTFARMLSGDKINLNGSNIVQMPSQKRASTPWAGRMSFLMAKSVSLWTGVPVSPLRSKGQKAVRMMWNTGPIADITTAISALKTREIGGVTSCSGASCSELVALVMSISGSDITEVCPKVTLLFSCPFGKSGSPASLPSKESSTSDMSRVPTLGFDVTGATLRSHRIKWKVSLSKVRCDGCNDENDDAGLQIPRIPVVNKLHFNALRYCNSRV